uniref:Uncharacterized protein n=1 Tax=Oryza punctata TaxID=4537 RepID=A0A0E0LEL3_ORYPU
MAPPSWANDPCERGSPVRRHKQINMVEAAKDVVDLEKAIDIMDAAALVEPIAGEKKEVLLPADLRIQVQRDASKLNNEHARKKYWLLLWFLIVVWVMILTDNFFVDGNQQNDHAESNNPHSTLAKFIGLLSVICLMFRASN